MKIDSYFNTLFIFILVACILARKDYGGRSFILLHKVINSCSLPCTAINSLPEPIFFTMFGK